MMIFLSWIPKRHTSSPTEKFIRKVVEERDWLIWGFIPAQALQINPDGLLSSAEEYRVQAFDKNNMLVQDGEWERKGSFLQFQIPHNAASCEVDVDRGKIIIDRK